MATVIDNTHGTDRIVEVDRGDSAAGWAVAIIVLLIVIAAGAYAWTHYYSGSAAQTNGTAPSASVNVTLPSAGYAPPSADTSGAGGNATAPATQ